MEDWVMQGVREYFEIPEDINDATVEEICGGKYSGADLGEWHRRIKSARSFYGEAFLQIQQVKS